jgi:hypothetical protein
MQPDRQEHGAFQGGPADFAVPLSHVAVTHREQRPVKLHRQIEDRSHRDVPGVHVSPDTARADHLVEPRLGPVHVNGTGDRVDGREMEGRDAPRLNGQAR